MLHIRATEILKSKLVHSTDDVIQTCNRQSQIVTKTNDSSFSSKRISEIDYFSNTVQPVVSKQSRDNPKSLKTGACLIQGSINIRCGVWFHPFFFQWPKGSLFFIKSLLVYKFQGRQLDKKKSFQNVQIKYLFLNNAVLIFFGINKLTRFEKENLLKSVFLLNFIWINIELQNNINLIYANESTIPE